jgi:hypothetical protein
VYENRVLGEYLDLSGRQEIMYEEILYLRYSQFLLSTSYSQGDQIKEDGIGREWRMHGKYVHTAFY